MTNVEITQAVQRWVETIVVGLNLCPFAARELNAGRVRFALTEAATEEDLLQALHDEITRLNEDATAETTLLIHPNVLQNFDDYNQFLDLADELLTEFGFEGSFQIASFHPAYQFADTERDDVENFTNRSPYPLLHLLREESLAAAIARFPDVEQIPARNIQAMRRLGAAQLLAMFSQQALPHPHAQESAT